MTKCLLFTEKYLCRNKKRRILRFVTKNIIYVTLTTELFIDKDASKTDDTFHEECHLKRKNKISDMSYEVLI